MGFDPISVLYVGIVCSDCNTPFNIWSSTGPVRICDDCAMARCEAIFKDIPNVSDLFPVPGDRVTCGLRRDLTKKQRRHHWISLGIDTRHYGAFGDFLDMEVFACTECGRDKVHKLKEGN